MGRGKQSVAQAGVRWRCDQCDAEVVPREGVTALWRRGHWWCIKHARTFRRDGVVMVDFPSGGKLVPSTILASEAP